MKNIDITIDKDSIVQLFRDKVYKIAEAAANNDNFRSVYNIKHDSTDNIDSYISDSLFDNWFNRTEAIVAEYEIPCQITHTIRLSLPSASIATDKIASNIASEYILNGLMAGWIKDTVPNMLKQYEAYIAESENELKRVIYTKKAPTP